MTNLYFVVFVNIGFPEQMQLIIIQSLRKKNEKKEVTAFVPPTETKLKTKLVSTKPHFVNAHM